MVNFGQFGGAHTANFEPFGAAKSVTFVLPGQSKPQFLAIFAPPGPLILVKSCNATFGIHFLSESFLLSLASVSVKFPKSHDHTKDCKTYCHPIVL